MVSGKLFEVQDQHHMVPCQKYTVLTWDTDVDGKKYDKVTVVF